MSKIRQRVVVAFEWTDDSAEMFAGTAEEQVERWADNPNAAITDAVDAWLGRIEGDTFTVVCANADDGEEKHAVLNGSWDGGGLS